MAVISLDLSSTATWPNVRLALVAQTLTKCNGPSLFAGLPDRRRVLPSMAKWLPPSWACRACNQTTKQRWKVLGQSRWKRRSKVSWEGMPLGRVRNVASQWRRRLPKASIWGKLLAPAMTAQMAMTRMSVKRCRLRRLRRGSLREAKCLRIDKGEVAIVLLRDRGDPGRIVGPTP